MDYTLLAYLCPKCGSNSVAQDPVCAQIGKPLMLEFFCCNCGHKWEHPYEPPNVEIRNREASTMQVAYNGFTGELVKLERHNITYQAPSVNKHVYDLSIYDSEKNVTHSFTGVKLEDVKFLGGAVAFGG